MDVDAIEPGVNFKELIEESLAEVEALIAVIGRGWLTTVDADGQRRLDDERDFVRLEIAQALDRNIRVVPVLVNGAGLPRAADLPADLVGLIDRNALELKQTDWKAGVASLVTSLERLIGPIASEPAPSDKPATDAPTKRTPSLLDRPAFLDKPATDAPKILLEQLNPGERLEDWFDADVFPVGNHYVIGITATRLLAGPVDPAAKPRSIDFVHVRSVTEAGTTFWLTNNVGPRCLELSLKGNRADFRFVPRGDMKKLLSELQSRVNAASS